ncbi:hypothetical protein CDAR_19991 [Caerostris darwini]|uniref:Uncharacterized protein n=1 Tax=Caerostris darwini TaxID=1538125 RepID=A0AAV4PUM6_9ARAC|nr:hypothetical protein CDAR_19991 [Caerostris darwini]
MYKLNGISFTWGQKYLPEINAENTPKNPPGHACHKRRKLPASEHGHYKHRKRDIRKRDISPKKQKIPSIVNLKLETASTFCSCNVPQGEVNARTGPWRRVANANDQS